MERDQQPVKPPRTFISELRTQLEVIDSELTKILNRGTWDVWGPKVRPADAPEYKRLSERRKVIVKRIIEHDP